MKKVGIVSCYFQKNYGSMLQALATQMALDKLGYENETINISGFSLEIRKSKVKYFVKASLTSDILLSKFGMAKNVIKKKISSGTYKENVSIRSIKFDSFYNKHFKFSESFSSKKSLHDKCKEKYDAVLVGSDQLWLPANIAADYYTLSFVPNEVNTVAYSTSFGQSVLPLDTEKKAAIFLKKIRHIGVREESGQKLIEKLTGRKVPVVCDPTLLFSGYEWMNIQNPDPIINEPYIFCYFLGNNPPHRKFVKKLSKQTGCKIVALIHLDEYIKSDDSFADITPFDVDPSDFLNLIRNASFVCTDSFHCSVFSMLYRRSFFTFRRYSRQTKSSTNTRLDTLFNIAGITDGIFNGDENIDDCLNRKIDYDNVHKKLEESRIRSYEYLKNALLDERSTDL